MSGLYQRLQHCLDAGPTSLTISIGAESIGETTCFHVLSFVVVSFVRPALVCTAYRWCCSFKKSSVIQTTTCDSGQTLLNRLDLQIQSQVCFSSNIKVYISVFSHKQALFGCAARYLNCNPRNCATHLRWVGHLKPVRPCSARVSRMSFSWVSQQQVNVYVSLCQNHWCSRAKRELLSQPAVPPTEVHLNTNPLFIVTKYVTIANKSAGVPPSTCLNTLCRKHCSLTVYWWISIEFYTLLSTPVLIWKPPLSQTKSCPETHVSSYCCPLCAQLFNFIL